MQAASQWGEHRNHRIRRDRHGDSSARPYAVDQPSAKRLAQRISNPKGDYDGGVVGIGPVEIDLQEWRENRKRLTVKIVDYGRGEE